MNISKTIFPFPWEILAELPVAHPDMLSAQVDALCDLMDIERRPVFDAERRLLLAIRRSVDALARAHIRQTIEITT